MSPWPPPVAPDADVQEAAQTMLYLDVQRSFVVEAGKVVGVISQTDIVDAVAAARI
jgi:CBS domain-containing protein